MRWVWDFHIGPLLHLVDKSNNKKNGVFGFNIFQNFIQFSEFKFQNQQTEFFLKTKNEVILMIRSVIDEIIIIRVHGVRIFHTVLG